MTYEQFTNKYYNFALAATKNTGLSPVLILSQAYLESRGGKSLLAAKYNNFFGVKSTPVWQGKTVNLKTTEQTKDGVEYPVIAKFKVYNSAYDSFIEQIKFLKNNPRYTKAGLFTYANNFDKQADTLQRAGYATDIKYSEKLKKLNNIFSGLVNKVKDNAPIASLIPFLFMFLIAKKFV